MANHFCETDVGFTSHKQDRVKRRKKLRKNEKQARKIEKSNGYIIEEGRKHKKGGNAKE